MTWTRAEARANALTRWAHEPDPAAATAPARAGFMARFLDEVDPERLLDPEDRARRADRAMRAHMTRLAIARTTKRKSA